MMLGTETEVTRCNWTVRDSDLYYNLLIYNKLIRG